MDEIKSLLLENLWLLPTPPECRGLTSSRTAQASAGMRRARTEAGKGKRLGVKIMDKRVDSKITREKKLRNIR